MTKKCLGCGVILQDSNNNKEGYVDTLDKDICERCFKLKYYGEYKNDGSEGIGVLQFDTGDIYQGEFYNNFIDGVGKYFFEDGEYHEGFYAVCC